VIPPEQNADFVAHMEEVLDLYQQPYDPDYPVVNMDEKPVQLIEETRTPIPATPGKPMRYDYEYERKGTASLFLFTEALTGWRRVDAQPQRTAKQWAEQVKELLDDDYPEAKQVTLVCDNLNTHKMASLYEAFEPSEARRLAKRLDIRYTPKHGSWLNIAEVELSVLSSQCLDRRIAELETMQNEIKAWEQERNLKQKGVDWRFTTEKARIRLKRLYPQYQS
jgi:uncharacterized small protein (DUF1192 family)